VLCEMLKLALTLIVWEEVTHEMLQWTRGPACIEAGWCPSLPFSTRGNPWQSGYMGGGAVRPFRGFGRGERVFVRGSVGA
jgi:hypothetical protein